MSLFANLDKRSALGEAMARSEEKRNNPQPPVQEQPETQKEEPASPEPQKPVVTEEPPKQPEAPNTPPEVTVDPYEPLKARLGERPLEEWLSEVDSAFNEKEALKLQVDEATKREAQIRERLIEYDVRNSEEFQQNVIMPRQLAESDYLALFSNDKEYAKKVLDIQNNKELSDDEKIKIMKETASDIGVSFMDLRKGLRAIGDAIKAGDTYVKNWEQTRVQKQQDALKRVEEQRKANEDSFRSTQRTLAYKAELKAKELGIPLEGITEAKEQYLRNVEKLIANEQPDLEYEATCNILGRLLLANQGSLKETFAKLQKLEEAARVTPQTSTGDKNANGSGHKGSLVQGTNPLSERMGAVVTANGRH